MSIEQEPRCLGCNFGPWISESPVSVPAGRQVLKVRLLRFRLAAQANLWVQLAPSGSPPSARSDHAVAWSHSADGLYVFGGRDSSGLGLNNQQCFERCLNVQSRAGVGTSMATQVSISMTCTSTSARRGLLQGLSFPVSILPQGSCRKPTRNLIENRCKVVPTQVGPCSSTIRTTIL